MKGTNDCTREELHNAIPTDVTLVTPMGLDRATKIVDLDLPALGIAEPALVVDRSKR